VYYYSPSQYVYPPSYYEVDPYIGSPNDSLYVGSPYTPQYFTPPYYYEASHMYPGTYGSPYTPYDTEEYGAVFFPTEYEAGQTSLPQNLEKKAPTEEARKERKKVEQEKNQRQTEGGSNGEATVGSPVVPSAPIEMRIKKLSLEDQ